MVEPKAGWNFYDGILFLPILHVYLPYLWGKAYASTSGCTKV